MDIADRADQECDAFLTEARRRAAAFRFMPGVPGECEYCGEMFARLIGDACARCRDERKLR